MRCLFSPVSLCHREERLPLRHKVVGGGTALRAQSRCTEYNDKRPHSWLQPSVLRSAYALPEPRVAIHPTSLQLVHFRAIIL